MSYSRAVSFFGPVLVFCAAALWATDAPFRSQLTQGLSSNFIVLVEHGISLFIAIPILILSWRDVRKLSRREWAAVLAIAIGGSALASIAFTQSFHYVNPSVSILLQKVQPLIAIVLAVALLGERMHKNFWFWAVTALVGAYFVSFPDLKPQLYDGEAFNPNTIGVLLALSAAGLWGASTVLGKYVLRTAAFQTLTALRFSIAFIFLFMLAVQQNSIPALSSVTTKDWVYLTIVALTSGVFSLSLYYYGLQYTRASIATLAELGFPLAAVFVNAHFIASAPVEGAFWGLVTAQWIGTALLLCALVMLTRVNQETENP